MGSKIAYGFIAASSGPANRACADIWLFVSISLGHVKCKLYIKSS